jgi:DNA-binding NtrC family response regulator
MTPVLNILVVDDNRSAADALARLLRKQGDAVHAVYDGRTAIEQIGKRDDLDVVLTDLKMAQVDGIQVLRAARAKHPPIETIVFTAFGAVDVAVTAMRLGARDFLTKPVTVEQVNSRLNELRGTEGPSTAPTLPFIATAPTSIALIQKLKRVATVPSSVWIQGEIGSGREFAARTLHAFGGGSGEFVIRRNFQSTDPWPEQGTVLLSSVDSLSNPHQDALYRSLDTVPQEVRLIATARGDGRQQVSDGTLSAELYYGLAVVVIQVPPLRRRAADVLPLFNTALAAYAERYQLNTPVVSDTLAQQLQQHSWPGNVRELLNFAERTVVMGADQGVVQVTPVPSGGTGGLPDLKPGFSLSKWLESMERRMLVEALRKCHGDRSAAGRLLGVERNTLRYKLNKYGLLDP